MTPEQCTQVAYYHREGWQPWEIAETLGLSVEEVERQLAGNGHQGSDRSDLGDERAGGRRSRSADSADSADTPAWEEPARLGADLNLPAFPLEALPAWIALFVEALATFTQTPPDLGAMLSIGTLAAAASRRVVVRVRRGWEEPLNAYVGVGLPSGSRKSPVFGPIMAPLEMLERELVRQARRAAREAEAAGAADLPAMPQLIAEDITPEAVASLLAEQGGRLALLSDEGGPLELISRYRETPNLEVYLKGHTGTRALRVNRKGRPPEFVERPSLTIALAVQPDVLRALGEHPTSRARGLTARFLYSLPADNVGRRDVDPPEIPAAIASAYSERMLTLARSLASLADVDGDALAVSLDDAAAKAHLEFMRRLEGRMNPETGDLAHPSHIREWTAKLAGATVRVAGLLHLAEHVRDGWGRPIDAATVQAAIQVADYLVPHALAVFDLMSADQAVADARYVLAWLERADITRFKRRDALAALRRFSKVSDLDGPLELLEAHGYIRVENPEIERPKGPGRKPSPTYAVNPLWRQQYQRNQQKARA